MPARPKPKARPGARTSPQQTKTLGQAEKQSRPKAESAVRRSEVQASEEVAYAPDGFPLSKLEFSSSELIPTGNYANVTIGPYKVTIWVDSREPELDDETLSNLANMANQLAESSLADVMGVQRALVLESLNMDQDEK